MRMIHAIIACVLATLPAVAQQAPPAATIADVAWPQGYWDLFRREGPDGLTVEIAMRGKDGAPRTEVLRFKRKPI